MIARKRRRRVAGPATRLLLPALLAVPFTGAPAHAGAEAPPAFPLVDATVRYHVAPSGGPTEDVTVSFGGAGRFLRIDGPPGQGETILDRDRRTVTVVVPDPHVFMVIPTTGPITDPFMLGAGMHYARAGTRQVVAGIACDDWRVGTGKGDASACVTPSGVLLAARGADGSGASGSLTALTVSFAPIPPGRFAPPPGDRRIAHPAAPAPGAG